MFLLISVETSHNSESLETPITAYLIILIEYSSWNSGKRIRYALPTDRASSRDPVVFICMGK